MEQIINTLRRYIDARDAKIASIVKQDFVGAAAARDSERTIIRGLYFLIKNEKEDNSYDWVAYFDLVEVYCIEKFNKNLKEIDKSFFRDKNLDDLGI